MAASVRLVPTFPVTALIGTWSRNSDERGLSEEFDVEAGFINVLRDD
jgi:hypothetical protein